MALVRGIGSSYFFRNGIEIIELFTRFLGGADRDPCHDAAHIARTATYLFGQSALRDRFRRRRDLNFRCPAGKSDAVRITTGNELPVLSNTLGFGTRIADPLPALSIDRTTPFIMYTSGTTGKPKEPSLPTPMSVIQHYFMNAVEWEYRARTVIWSRHRLPTGPALPGSPIR